MSVLCYTHRLPAYASNLDEILIEVKVEEMCKSRDDGRSPSLMYEGLILQLCNSTSSTHNHHLLLLVLSIREISPQVPARQFLCLHPWYCPAIIIQGKVKGWLEVNPHYDLNPPLVVMRQPCTTWASLKSSTCFWIIDIAWTVKLRDKSINHRSAAKS